MDEDGAAQVSDAASGQEGDPGTVQRARETSPDLFEERRAASAGSSSLMVTTQAMPSGQGSPPQVAVPDTNPRKVI
ncbi:hypothetical protein JRQ81_001743 [Phrynocephalus forsythii]|uniref:Uncharacterized protein n=1 Tax=Phrynocephalus forsythii TaxID=171643 RepID=A0A9Q0YDG5_9SAUR|nr:hypothetical protein JRQ81_001743 [Phrynocephalus forsythii]